MWITINYDNNEVTLEDFLKKLPSKDSFLELINEIQSIDEKWRKIKINFYKKPINKLDDKEDIVIKQI
jgi:hypothetical protein